MADIEAGTKVDYEGETLVAQTSDRGCDACCIRNVFGDCDGFLMNVTGTNRCPPNNPVWKKVEKEAPLIGRIVEHEGKKYKVMKRSGGTCTGCVGLYSGNGVGCSKLKELAGIDGKTRPCDERKIVFKEIPETKSFCVKVNPEQSRKLQEAAFLCGYRWPTGKKYHELCTGAIGFCGDGRLDASSMKGHIDCGCTEISYEEAMKRMGVDEKPLFETKHPPMHPSYDIEAMPASEGVEWVDVNDKDVDTKIKEETTLAERVGNWFRNRD